MGVCELRGGKEKCGARPGWGGGQSVIVVRKEEDIRLRFVLKYSSLPARALSYLADKFSKGIHESSKESSVLCQRITGKRLMNEQKRLRRALDFFGKKGTPLGFDFVATNLLSWQVQVFIDPETVLGKEMNAYGVPFVSLEVTFPPNYPLSPPFVRIVAPHFANCTEYILDGGSLCIDLFSPARWAQGVCMEALLVQIKALILEGEGHLDSSCLTLPYTLEEAKASYVKAARANNWIV